MGREDIYRSVRFPHCDKERQHGPARCQRGVAQYAIPALAAHPALMITQPARSATLRIDR
jgi:hypothetical protein